MADIGFGNGMVWHGRKATVESMMHGIHALCDVKSQWHDRTTDEQTYVASCIGGWSLEGFPISELYEVYGYLAVMAKNPNDWSKNWTPEYKRVFAEEIAAIRDMLARRLNQLNPSRME
jgi:hypothetical protein